MPIDRTDLAIIELLQEDGRRPVADMARLLGISGTTVQRRIDRLTEDGVIRIMALAQEPLVGLPVQVVLAIRASLSQVQNVQEMLAAQEEVVWVAWTTGAADLLVEAFFHSHDHLREFLQERLAQVPGLERVDTNVVLSLGKSVHKIETMVRFNDRLRSDARQLERVGASTSTIAGASISGNGHGSGHSHGTGTGGEEML